MFSIKASLILLVLAVLFVCSSQAQINITIAEAEAANSSAKQWLRRQNVGRAGGVELLQPVTAKISSHYAGSGHTFPAEKCIDGDTEGPSKDGNLCHTHYGYPKSERAPWLAIDYGSAVTINKVEIFNREDGGGDRAKNVDVRVSNELPTSASQMFSGGSLLGRFAGPGTDGQHIIITGEAMSGRYVIVQMDNGVGVPLNLKEVRAFGAKGELLQPVTASMSSRFESLYEPAKCIDGDTITPSIKTNTGGGNMCHSRNERSPWLAIDYGARVNVQRVEIFNREDCCGDWARNVDVRVSNELPTSASEMFSGGSLLGHFAGPATNGQHIIITGETISGRYVIVQMDNSEDHPLNLREVKAFGVKGELSTTTIPPPSINNNGVELKPVSATLSSSVGSGVGWGVAANCIDGNLMTQCHSKNDRYPWIALDFGSTAAIQRVEIFNRADCSSCWQRTKNVEVLVSDVLPTSASQKFSGGSLLGTFPGPGTSGQHIKISGEWAYGRFVIVQMDNGDDPLNLQLVKAFGYPPTTPTSSTTVFTSKTTTTTTTTTPTSTAKPSDVSSEVPTTHVSKNNNNAGALLIGFISLSGVLLLLLILTVVYFVCRNRSRTNAAKTDINPVYGADYEADAAKENNRRVSNADNYDYMGE